MLDNKLNKITLIIDDQQLESLRKHAIRRVPAHTPPKPKDRLNAQLFAYIVMRVDQAEKVASPATISQIPTRQFLP